MKILSWNCQGLGSPLTIRALTALVAKEKPDVIFLVETKNRELVLSRIHRKLRFVNSYITNLIGTAGGLAMFWHSHVSIQVEIATPNFFDTICSEIGRGITMRLTCIHAPATPDLRQPLWTALRRLAFIGSLPWVCVGDSNEIAYQWEKFGEELVKEWLDRVLCTWNWWLTYSEAEVFAFPAVGSDHSPLMLNTEGQQRRNASSAVERQAPRCLAAGGTVLGVEISD
ncbi:uncharacterized protein [Rutidosis leptorrhynchoides]|uniref:uncharacterized protein n=1 Tax=Rutidosis leptorrhynchoides TaxID=125765 RepID=UPI003A9A558E